MTPEALSRSMIRSATMYSGTSCSTQARARQNGPYRHTCVALMQGLRVVALRAMVFHGRADVRSRRTRVGSHAARLGQG